MLSWVHNLCFFPHLRSDFILLCIVGLCSWGLLLLLPNKSHNQHFQDRMKLWSEGRNLIASQLQLVTEILVLCWHRLKMFFLFRFWSWTVTAPHKCPPFVAFVTFPMRPFARGMLCWLTSGSYQTSKGMSFISGLLSPRHERNNRH